MKRLFLGNCSFDINDDLLKEALGKYGTIESIHWVTDRETGKFYGTGFVEFATADEANAALGADGVEIAGRAVRIQIAKPRANEGKVLRFLKNVLFFCLNKKYTYTYKLLNLLIRLVLLVVHEVAQAVSQRASSRCRRSQPVARRCSSAVCRRR